MSSHFHTLTITDLRRETADAVSVRLGVPDDLRSAFKYKAGQHLTLRATVAGEELRRNYSICASPREDELRIAIKRITDGRFSNWANTSLKVGQTIEAMAPKGSFTWAFSPQAANHYVAFAGGSGITPVLSLLKTALTEEPNSDFTLFYGNRDAASIIFLEELARLKDLFLSRLRIHHVLELEQDEVDLFNGRLDREKCDLLLDCMTDTAEVAAFFICGPGPMMDAAEAALIDRGVSRERILIERFTVDRPTGAAMAALDSKATEASGLPMTLIIDGRRRLIQFDAAQANILDNARAAGLPAPFACKAGVCATCRARLISGKVSMAANYSLSEEDLAAGYILTCQSIPITEDVVIDYDV